MAAEVPVVPAARCVICNHREDQHDTLPDGTRPCRSIGHEKGLTCRECMRLISAEHVDAVMALRGADDDAFAEAWGAYYATLNHVRNEIGPGWQAFFTDVHQSALASAVLTLRERQRRAGIPGTVVDGILCDAATVAENVAEGLRQQQEFERSTGALDVMAELHRLAGCDVPPEQHRSRQPFRGPIMREASMVVRGMDTDPGTQAAADELLRMATEAEAAECTGCGGTGACAGGPCAHPAASTAPLAAGLPLVKRNCPACGSASLFLGVGGYVTCSRTDCRKPDAASDVLGA
ncbi:MAG: hypothetical protein HOY79_33875 [Streptomyces sp.]|nr:hypothetical protein [Streptomyces sp.]NUS11319.1 hypothetical protein [Streptomyces sp.]NUS23406.1 hypothetical protein [Streptomyces sp.]